jgi:hypothetical protein
MDPFETGEEGVLDSGLIAAKNLMTMFDGLAQVEILFTRGQQVTVVARLEEIPLARLPTLNESIVESHWSSRLEMCDGRNRRIRLRLWNLGCIQRNDVALCTKAIVDAEIRSDLRCMRAEVVYGTDVLHFHPKTLACVYRLSLRTALRMWCGCLPPEYGPQGLDVRQLVDRGWTVRYAETSATESQRAAHEPSRDTVQQSQFSTKSI